MNKIEQNLGRLLKILMITSAAFAFTGWYVYDGLSPLTTAVWSAFYKMLQTFIFETGFDAMPVPLILQIAAYLAPLSLAGTLMFAIFHSARERFVTLSFTLGRRRDHVIIAGPPEFCIEFLNGYRKESDNPVLFMLPPDLKGREPDVLSSHHLLFADPGRAASWKRSVVRKAGCAIVSVSSPDEMEAVREHVRSQRKGIKRRFYLHLGLETMNQVRFFARSELFLDSEYFWVEGFNIRHLAAAHAVEEFAPHFTMPRNELNTTAPHLVIDGFDQYARWIIVEAAQLFHYPALKKLQITLICDDNSEIDDFIQQQPGINDVVDLNILQRGNIFSDLNDAGSHILPEGTADPYAVFVFSRDSWEVPDVVRRWRRYLTIRHSQAPYQTDIRVFLPAGIQQPDFHRRRLMEYRELEFTVHSISDFLKLDRFLDNRETIDGIAEKIHGQYQQKYQMKPWVQLSDDVKDMNRRSARHLKIKLYLSGWEISDDLTLPEMAVPSFSAEQIRMFAEVEHKRWNAEKYLEGFIPGEAVENESEAKFRKNVLLIHKDLRPFVELSEEDISKDIETFRDLPALLETILEEKRLRTINDNR